MHLQLTKQIQDLITAGTRAPTTRGQGKARFKPTHGPTSNQYAKAAKKRKRASRNRSQANWNLISHNHALAAYTYK